MLVSLSHENFDHSIRLINRNFSRLLPIGVDCSLYSTPNSSKHSRLRAGVCTVFLSWKDSTFSTSLLYSVFSILYSIFSILYSVFSILYSTPPSSEHTPQWVWEQVCRAKFPVCLPAAVHLTSAVCTVSAVPPECVILWKWAKTTVLTNSYVDQ